MIGGRVGAIVRAMRLGVGAAPPLGFVARAIAPLSSPFVKRRRPTATLRVKADEDDNCGPRLGDAVGTDARARIWAACATL